MPIKWRLFLAERERLLQKRKSLEASYEALHAEFRAERERGNAARAVPVDFQRVPHLQQPMEKLMQQQRRQRNRQVGRQLKKQLGRKQQRRPQKQQQRRPQR